MKIKSIRIDNFRGIEHIELPTLDEHLNLFVGANGAGKTSILDAISYILSWYLARIRNVKSPGITIPKDNIRNNSKRGCMLSIDTDDAGEWTLVRNKSYKKIGLEDGKTDLSRMMVFVNDVQDNVERGEGIPVIMYYPVDRAINNAPAHLKRNQKESEIWEAYDNALKGNAEFRAFFEWYRRQEDYENERIRDNSTYRDKKLTVIREAISKFFPEFSNLRVRRNPQKFVITKGEEVIEFNQLSQGEKCYLALVCDLARRFAIANPNSANPLEGEGIVIIDEIDLHLHPKWQMEIIGKLRETFPNCQFFMSTHSPHVVSDLNAEQIYMMENGRIVEREYNPYGRLVSDILSSYFEVSNPRNIKVREDIRAAYEALRNNDKQTFETIFERLTDLLGKADPDMVNLKLESIRRNKK